MNEASIVGNPGRTKSLVKIGGALGIAGSSIGLLIFLGACAGFSAAFKLALIPLAFSVPGMILTLIGATCQKHDKSVEDTHVMAAIFVNSLALLGGLLEVAMWLHWTIFSVPK